MFTISAGQANTDTEQVLVIPGDTSGTWGVDTSIGITLSFVLACGPTYQGVAGWQAGNFLATSACSNGVGSTGNIFNIFDVGLYLDPNNTGKAPPWQMPDEAEELAACQRYYQKGIYTIWVGNSVVSNNYFATGNFIRSMRTTPTFTSVSNLNLNFPAVAGSLAAQPYSILEQRGATGTASYSYFSSSVNAIARM
jgi:hypothetical protein